MTQKIICNNRKAQYNFSLIEKFEAGIALRGTEVKALREGRGNMNDCYARIHGNEIFLENFHISPYSHGNIHNHEPLRPRKLLLHKHEIRSLIGKVTIKGLTLVPTKAYFSHGKVKVEIALAQGKKLHDKREDLKQKAVRRDTEREFRDR
ncbi:MAG TPA: SsrA-binding protein SmpB [Proteobacteria bacterium]|nr:SsrA-binding protein SmpB [Deltaproteobacteria bacterium]HDS16649.1 SsrA-binding protein SmpB [Pseudomonadota bacterium]